MLDSKLSPYKQTWSLALPSAMVMVVALATTNISHAADWNVTQTSNVSAPAPSLSQDNAGSSRQALNAVALDTSNDDLSAASQTTNLGGGSLSLMQSGAATNGSVQSLNLVSARSVNELTQTVSGLSSATLSLDSTLGSSNVQALNYSAADANTEGLSQTVNANDVTLVNNSAGNVQALNYAESASYSGALQQNVNLLSLDAANLGGTDVRVNSIKGDTSGATSVLQTTNIGTLTVGGGTVILNHIEP